MPLLTQLNGQELCTPVSYKHVLSSSLLDLIMTLQKIAELVCGKQFTKAERQDGW